MASTKDISIGGLYMNTQTILPEGAVLTLRIPLAGAAGRGQRRSDVQQSGTRRRRTFSRLTEKDRALMERELPKP